MESLQQCLEAVLEYCRPRVVETTFNIFFTPLAPVSFEDNLVTLSTPSSFLHGTIVNKYSPLLKEAFCAVLGFDVELEVIIAKDDEPLPDAAAVAVGDAAFTFDSFIVGSNNKFAHAAAQAVAARPATNYNPLFIYGASGLGKTHLIIAIKNEVLRRNENYNVVYVDGEQFTNELIAAIGRGSTVAFHETYRSADMLLVDDIQFIAGKDTTQEEFFHTFNTLYKSGKQIVLTSDRPPKEIRQLEERLRTRFEWGLIADIQPPDFETRAAIINRKSKTLGFELPVEVTEFIANRIKTNVRQLEGIVKKINAYRLMEGATPSVGIAQNAIRDILSEEQRPLPITIEKIIEEVARTYNVSPEDIRSAKQNAAVSQARQVSMYIIREVTGITMEKIGEEFNGRNYSTVVYAINKIEDILENDNSLRLTVNDIIKNAKS